MPATGHRLTRRAILVALAALPVAAADPAQEVWDVLTGMASALASADALAFLSYFDPSIQHYDDIRAAVNGLVAEYEVQSGIDPVDNTGDTRNRTIEVNWSMHLVSHSDLKQMIERHMTVTIRFERRPGKKWKVVAFEPLSALALPPRL